MPKNSHMLSNQNMLSELVFAILERIYTLYSQIISSSQEGNSISLKNKHFIRCLNEIFNTLIYCLANYEGYLTQDEEKDKCYKNLCDLFKVTIKLSDELVILPKQDVPIEIYRFLRVFNRWGIANVKGHQTPSTETNQEAKFALYSGVDRSANIYENHPLQKFENDHLIPILEEIYGSTYDGLKVNEDSTMHICIPNEETNSPLSWPILTHEVGHQVMSRALLENKKIEQAFFTHAGNNEYHAAFKKRVQLFVDEGYEIRDIFSSWLTECWCDLYAFFATGPAVIYAQRNAFVLQSERKKDVGTATHPPYLLRLLILQVMFENFQMLSPNTTELVIAPLDNELCSWLEHEDDNIAEDIYSIAQWFLPFFNDHFKMDDYETENLHDHIIKLKESAPKFDAETINHLVARLDEGFPIPSLPCTNDKLKEKETSIHEIMLAAWISHDKALHKSIVDELMKELPFMRQKQSAENAVWNVFVNNIYPYFERFNQAVLRSIQISEWVELLKANGSFEEEIVFNDKAPTTTSPFVLADKDIKNLITNGELKVIPLIDIERQLGSASLDVRLGPTFQTYQPNQSGVVDFTDSESVKNVLINSSIVDLDFKEGIVLAPGQFVLAHTMEYFGFPKTVAAQIEGRSSFARLGVQIHMTANLIDPGFHGSITFEIFNAGPNPIRLFPGYRIGQLRFFNCEQPDVSYDKKTGAKYKGQLVYSKSLVSRDYEVERLVMKCKCNRDGDDSFQEDRCNMK